MFTCSVNVLGVFGQSATTESQITTGGNLTQTLFVACHETYIK